jgi:hypothetical protein
MLIVGGDRKVSNILAWLRLTFSTLQTTLSEHPKIRYF